MLQTEATAQIQVLCHHLPTKKKNIVCPKTNKKHTHVISISYQYDLSKRIKLLWVLHILLHRHFANTQQIGQYFHNQMIWSWSMFRSAQSQQEIQTKNLMMWWNNLVPEDFLSNLCSGSVSWGSNQAYVLWVWSRPGFRPPKRWYI